MRRVLFLVMAAGLVRAPAQATSRSETQEYTAGTGVVLHCSERSDIVTVANQHVERETSNTGGACFAVRPGESTLLISIMNEVGGVAAGRFMFDGSDYVSFCGTSAQITIPSGARTLYVEAEPGSANFTSVGVPIGVLGGCSDLVSGAVHGAITVTFS